jgi:hypothetical protein
MDDPAKFRPPKAHRCSIRGRPSLSPIRIPFIIGCARPSQCNSRRSDSVSQAASGSHSRIARCWRVSIGRCPAASEVANDL